MHLQNMPIGQVIKIKNFSEKIIVKVKEGKIRMRNKIKSMKKYCTNSSSQICVIRNENFFVGPLRGPFGLVSRKVMTASIID